jgi:spermidine/putrescine transport system permease protein
MKKLRSKIYLVIIMAFLYLPIIYLIAYSFNDGKTSVWKGFTWKWYEALFHDAQIMGSLKNTLIVAILASVIATILGTAAAIGIYNFKGGVRSAIQNVSNIPIINPEIVTGVSLMLLFTFAGVMMGFEMGVEDLWANGFSIELLEKGKAKYAYEIVELAREISEQ